MVSIWMRHIFYGKIMGMNAGRLRLKTIVCRAAYERLRALRGSEPRAQDVPRRRERPSCGTGAHDSGRHIHLHRFLCNQSPYAARLDAILRRGEFSRHELIYGELLLGVVAFVRDRNLHGRGVGWIDTFTCWPPCH